MTSGSTPGFQLRSQCKDCVSNGGIPKLKLPLTQSYIL
jgi:hypothetical protein